MSTRRGFFVTVDGPSGVGKTTVCQLMHSKLTRRGLPALLTAQPSSSRLGELVRHGTYEFCGPALTCLVAADRYHHFANEIEPALADGLLVICDRYMPSSLVLDASDGIDPKFLYDLYRHLQRPDLAIFLAASPAICEERLQIRGAYSRFQSGGLSARIAEAVRFREVAADLATRQYPVLPLEIGDRNASEVASGLAEIVIARHKSRKRI